jgi:hypothetical protein
MQYTRQVVILKPRQHNTGEIRYVEDGHGRVNNNNPIQDIANLYRKLYVLLWDECV